MKEIVFGHFVFTEIKESDDPYPKLTIEMIKYAKILLDEMGLLKDSRPAS